MLVSLHYDTDILFITCTLIKRFNVKYLLSDAFSYICVIVIEYICKYVYRMSKCLRYLTDSHSNAGSENEILYKMIQNAC